MKDFVMKKPN